MQPGMFNYPRKSSGKSWQEFTDVGPFSFIVPDGVHSVALSMCGGGANGGAGANVASGIGGIGGGGSSSFGYLRMPLVVLPGQIIMGRVGAANETSVFGPFTAATGNPGSNAVGATNGVGGPAPSPIDPVGSIDGEFVHMFSIGAGFAGVTIIGGVSPFLIGLVGAPNGPIQTNGSPGVYPGGGGGGGGGGNPGSAGNGGVGAPGVVLLEW